MLYNPSYLIKSRHDIYYFRYPLPIKAEGATKRISVSLGTRCPREALRLANALEYYSTNLIQALDLEQMNYEDVMSIFKDYYADVLERSKSRIDKDGPLPKPNIENIHTELSRIEELIDNDCDDITELYGLDEEPEEKNVHKGLQPIMERFDLHYKVGSKEYDMMKSAYKFARRNHFKDLLTYNAQATDYSLLEAQTVNANSAPKPQNKLANVLQGYLKELKPTISARSYKDQADCLHYLVDYFGADYPIMRLGIQEVQDIKAKLQVTPTGRNKGAKTKGKPLLEQIEIAEQEALNKLSTTSVNKYLGYFSSLFDWAKRNRLVETNVFDGIRIKNNKRDNRRKMFNKDEIARILEELNANSSGKVRNKSQYWGAMIAIYTGARRNEIGGLMVDDVKQDQESGIWYFEISDMKEEGKNIKSEAAKRIVPIHSKLLELGFMEYLEEAKKIVKTMPKQRGMSARLLYDLKYTEHDKWGRMLGQFMNDRLLNYLGLREKNKRTLHSLRHSFITYLDIAGTNAATIKSMVGHEQDTVTHDIYTHYSVAHLPQFKEAIEQLPY